MSKKGVVTSTEYIFNDQQLKIDKTALMEW